MKKFLTVLLALSVVFTYSFSAVGTVFAADNNSVAEALGYVTSIHDSAKNLVSDNGEQAYSGWDVSAANWALAYEDAYEALVDDVAKAKGTTAVDVLVGAGVTGASGLTDARDIKLALENYLAKKVTGTTYTTDHATPALKAQLAEEAVAAHKKANAIDTGIYSITEYTAATAKHVQTGTDYYWNKYSYVSGTFLSAGDALYVAKDVADSIITGLNDGIDQITTVDASMGADDIVECHSNLNALMAAHVALVGDTNNDNVEDADETWVYTFVPTIKILTTAEEAADGASNEATVAALKAQIASNIAQFKASAAYLGASVNTKAAYDKYLDAYNTAQTYLVENGAKSVASVNVSDTTLIENVKKAAEAMEDAADLKAETNKDGSVKYDAATIDANLKTILTALYSGNTPTVTLTKGAEITYVTTVEKVNEKAAVDVDADAMEYNGVAYYALEWKAVEAALDTYYAAVDAAVVSTDIADAKTALAKAIAKIDPASTVFGYYASGKLNTTADSEFTKLRAYAQLIAMDHPQNDQPVFAITDITGTMLTTGDDGTLVKYYIDKDARTVAEITALNAEIKALLDSAKTASALKAEAQNVVNMINALPAKANITVADKDAIEAAYNAYEDLNPAYKVYVTNYSTLKAAIDTVMKAEKDAFLAATKNLPATANVTIADKEAVQAVADMIGEYNGTAMYGYPEYSNAAVDALLRQIRALEFDAVKAAVKAVPAADKVTATDKEAVEAARAAYDALLANYGDKLTSAEVKTLTGYEKKIIEAEKALKAKIDEKNAQEKIAIQGTHMKINSSAAKGYIKISWKASNSDVTLDGVEVYRSTKKTSGFKKISTFKKQTSKKYTTNLKKGTKYYYYVKGYKMVGDEKVYTHNSIKVARTFRK